MSQAVRALLLLEGLHVLDHADGEAERLVDRRHPFGVATRQVIVDGHHVHALALVRRAAAACAPFSPALASSGVLPLSVRMRGAASPVARRERVEHHRQGRRERLSLAGLHLRDAAVVERHAADQLDVEVAHRERAPSRLAHERKALREQLFERLAFAGALAQHVHAFAQLLVGVQLELGLEGPDQLHALFVGLELLGLPHVEGAIEKSGHRPRIALVRRCR